MATTNVSVGGPASSKPNSTRDQMRQPTENSKSQHTALENTDIIGSTPIFSGSIYNKLTKTLIPFLTPTEVTRSHTANIDEVQIDGRSVSLAYYKGGGAPSVSFQVELYEDFLPFKLTKYDPEKSKKNEKSNKDKSSNEGESTILEMSNALRALTYPEYVDGVPTPPECVVQIGDGVKFVGRCNSVNETHEGKTGNTNDLKKKTYKHISFNLTFTVIREVGSSAYSAPSASEVEKGE